MEESIYVTNNNHHINESFTIDVPEHCPLCGKSMVPLVFPNGIMSDLPTCKNLYYQSFEVAFIARCTNCKHLYTNLFHINLDQSNRILSFGNVCQPVKNPEININFPEIINKEYSKFKEIYIQALQAEALHLNELVGMGLRKSLEFLVKDYVKKLYPDQKDEIENNTSLSNVINTYIDNDDLKKVGKGAAWLGNDETHYTKVWKDKDINDLKNYINVFMNQIVFKESVKGFEIMYKKHNESKKNKN